MQTASEHLGFGGAIQGLDRSRATLKLQDGCGQYCSYCIIPYVRKTWYSMPEDEAMRRVGRLEAAGFREIVLLGIHLGAYGTEKGEQDSLARVWESLLLAYPQVRFRLGSLEPMEATGRLVALIRDYPNACKHLHLPLQSGSDAILSAMNRPYLTKDFRERVRMIHGMIPDIALTTDVMVGFPGEGGEEFRQSLAFAEEMAFSRIHVFAYSRRLGTLAADMPGQVAKPVKDRRSEEFIRLGRRMGESYGDSWIGRRQQVLAEEEVSAGVWRGHGDNYMEVTFARCADGAGGDIRGSVVPLKIVGKSPHKPDAWHGVLE
jgi:threonylcarbamoyladenosine tRNA methylthiotransferase MtaB